jgi:hypothetical protein
MRESITRRVITGTNERVSRHRVHFYRPLNAAAKLPGAVRHSQASGAFVRRLPLVILGLAASTSAGAQIVRQGYQISAPSVWVSGGAALQQGFTVTDGTTGSVWQFGSATTYDGSLEKVVSSGITLGLRGSTGVVPLTYAGPVATFDADARVSRLFGTVRATSGTGFHTVLELSVGGTYYSDFRTQQAATKLEPLTGDTDFSFAFGYGFGFSISPRMSIDVVQDVTTSVHQKDGLAPGDNSTVRVQGTRLMGRIGLGGP